jgi:hypothetical protein
VKARRRCPGLLGKRQTQRTEFAGLSRNPVLRVGRYLSPIVTRFQIGQPEKAGRILAAARK